MAGLMRSVADIFGMGATHQQQPTPANPSGSPVAMQQTNSQASAGANPSVPSDSTLKSDGSVPAIPKAAEGAASPMAGYKELWELDPNAAPPASLVPDLSFDPAKLQASAAKLDFAKVIPAELMEKALKGDAASMMQAFNLTSQATFAQSTQVTAGILQDALTKQEKAFNETILPAKLRDHAVSLQLRVDNPAFNDPAMAPMVSMVEKQMQLKYPTSSAAEITQHAKTYLNSFASELLQGAGKTVSDKPVVDARSSAKSQGTDWEAWASYDLNSN